jgi:AraC-like DNA-binding protein
VVFGAAALDSAGADFASFRLPTQEIAPADGLGVWRDILGRTVMRLDVQRIPESDYFADLTVTTLPGLRILGGAVSASHVERTTANLVADGNDDFGLVINLAGGWTAETHGRALEQGAGEACLVSGSDGFALTRPAAGAMLALCVPRSALAPLAPGAEDLLLRPISAASPPLRLLRHYIGLLSDAEVAAGAEMRHAVVTHVHDLIALAVGPGREGAEIAGGRGLPAARLHAMKTDVLQNLDRHDLSLRAIARRHRMTPRHARRLFERDGTSFSDFVLNHRLARAHRMLGDPGEAHKSIASIVFECGFGDVSYFNRSFRRRYGATPSDVRAAALALQ